MRLFIRRPVYMYQLPSKNTIKFLNSKYHNYFGHEKLFYDFTDAILYNNTFFNSNGAVLEETIDERIFWDPVCICPLMHDFLLFSQEVTKRKQNIINNKINLDADFMHIDDAIDLTHAFGFYAFGHLFDTLQRLYPIQSLIHDNTNIKFIIQY